MKTTDLFALRMGCALLVASGVVASGELKKGVWSSSNCGAKPASPSLSYNDTIDNFNESVKAFNTWQAQALAYYNCLVKEANEDTKIISDSINQQQTEHNAYVQRINAEVAAYKAQVEAALQQVNPVPAEGSMPTDENTQQ